MPIIEAVGTAVPAYCLHQTEAKKMAEKLFQGMRPSLERYLSVFDHAAIERRYFCTLPEWFEESHSFSEKNDLYVRSACDLGVQAAMSCLKACNLSPEEVDHLIVVSSTGLATPSLDARLMNRLPFRADIRRTPIWGLGCAGGAVGLTLACEWAKAFPRGRALLLAVELCGLTFQRNDVSKSNLIAASLFADGAAAALISGDAAGGEGPQWLASMSTTWNDTLDVMGWNVTDDGLDVIFSRDIPAFVRRYLPDAVKRFLQRQQLKGLECLDHLIAHPGGVKVIQAYADMFQVPMVKFSSSLHVLKNYGNMSSPTVLFVLKEAMKEAGSGEYGLLFALGPGFSAEQVLLQW
ncbi:MAG: chalcone synthase [Bacillus thermozeamaize]|uniref:Chalcone synthase n=1 Tax=Bacillus thermozeamaize TaxID=230954 RepID=A0A1Y3PGS6_9BACI|nr:MAG: chalcone synthase [Bacillus thermozeamaize]